MFRITIEETTPTQDVGNAAEYVNRYEQTVETIDMRAVMAAVNKVPRKPRQKKEAK